jgi:hypothetical protein
VKKRPMCQWMSSISCSAIQNCYNVFATKCHIISLSKPCIDSDVKHVLGAIHLCTF